MAVIGRFIGINKYTDPKIRDLNGAKNDAVALYSLFLDTISGIDAKLLVDKDATKDNIENSLKEVLQEAKEEDEVVFFYSGHGSHDHRITSHDTSLSDIPSTTIPMQEIASLFKQSKAKSILFIIDCCFSGGATAKVLEDTPIPKDLQNPFESFSGQGRLIIAASNFDEPSYELPSTGHGILTKAILDTFQSADDPFDILVAINQVMEVVRAEAQRIGYTQTPVVVNSITGGFTLPKLVAGNNYFQAFPDKKGIKVTSNISDLSAFGINNALLAEWVSYFPNGLNSLQLTAINDYRILDQESLLVIAPTSSGKTFVGELASAKAMSQGNKAIFLLPYKALVNEKFDQFKYTYEEKLGYRVIRCTGDFVDQNEELIKGKYDIAFLTYEMFLNLSIAIPSVLNSVGLVVLDEAQFITDPARGITVELLLTNLITARQRGVSPQLIVLSAVIGDTQYFEDWLGFKKFVSTDRPVPLIEGVMNRNGIFKYLDESGNIQEEQIIPAGSIVQRRTKPSAQDMIVPLTIKLVSEGERLIIFRNQRGSAEGCAEYLASDLNLDSAEDEVQKLPKYNSSTRSESLRNCVRRGVAFHNSNLARDEKIAVEKIFRAKDSKVKVLTATTTVAAGINTPASTVILAEHEFVGEEGRPFTIAEYKNMAGRAGRVGFNEKGKSIILADYGTNPDALFQKYVLGKPENLNSSFSMNDLDTWIMKLFAQVGRMEKQNIVNLLSNTYGGYINNRNNPDWHKTIAAEIEALYAKMKDLGLVEEEGDFVQLSLLGKACGESALSFTSVTRLLELIKSFGTQNITNRDIMALVQALPEVDNSYTPMNKRGNWESRYVGYLTQRFNTQLPSLFQRYAGDNLNYYARCKRASLLHDWIEGVSTEQIEELYKSNNFFGNVSYGDIRAIADFTRYLLRSTYKIVSLVLPGQVTDESLMENLLRQLEVGIPEDALELLDIHITMSREEHLALRNAGILNQSSLFSTDEAKLEELLEITSLEQVKQMKINSI